MHYSFELNQFPVVTEFYSVTRNTYWKIAERNNILIFINNGECVISCDGESYTLKKGDVFFIPQNHPYTRCAIDNALCTMTYIHFLAADEIRSDSAAHLSAVFSETKARLDNELLSGETALSYPKTIYLGNKNTLPDSEKLFSLTNDIKLISVKRQLMCNLQSSIILCDILARLSQNTIDEILADNTLKNAALVPANLKMAIGYITKHYSEKISLTELADYCHVSKQQLIRYFKKAFNTTPINYIIDYKLSKAKELLFYSPQTSIKEIAAELGFDNQHYFTRIFSKFNNETPSHYRYRTVHYDEENKAQKQP